MSLKDMRERRRAQRDAAAQKLRETLAAGKERRGTAAERIKEARGIDMENLPTPDRFKIEVTDNLTGFGGPLGGFSRSKARGMQLSYKVVVTDIETGVPQHVRACITYREAFRDGRRWVEKACEGKRALSA